MLNLNKKATVLVYTIFLTLLALMLGIIVMNNSSSLILNQEFYDIQKKMNINIKSKVNLFGKQIKKYNSDGSGFIDNIGCPQNFTMYRDGLLFPFPVVNNNLDSELTFSGTLSEKFYCKANFDSEDVNIFFKGDYTDLRKVTYVGKELIVNSGSLDGDFGDARNTHFDLENTGNYYYSDNIDDNFNSDNFVGNSTGTVDYPDNYEDNDNFVRKNINGLIVPKSIQNIFWNNGKIERFISNNKNNTGSLNQNLGDVTSSNLFLNISTGATLKIIEFNKNNFDNFGKIRRNNYFTGSVTGSGYIEKNGNILSLNQNTNTNTYDFDFSTKGYIIFLENKTESNFINYNLSGKNNSGSGIFMNPINDFDKYSFKSLGYDVLILENGDIANKMLEISGIK